MTAVAAIVAGLIGHLTARRHARVELARLRSEHEQFLAQHFEPHRLRRQEAYQAFLDSAHRFHQDLGGIAPMGRPDEFRAWTHEFEHNLTAVSLLGTEPAWHAADRLAAVMEEAMKTAPKYPQDIEQKFITAWDDTVKAMRPDTASRATPPANTGPTRL